MTVPPSPPSPYEFDIAVSRSTDVGLTWSPVQLLHANGFCDIGWDETPEIATDANGHWVIVWPTTEPALGSSGGVFGEFDIAFATSSNLDAPPPVNDARPEGHTVPATLAPGESLGVGITFHNTGATTWTLESCYSLAVIEDSCSLFASNPNNRIALDSSLATDSLGAVPPGARHQFITQITVPSDLPSTQTLCTARLQMIREGAFPFGSPLDLSIQIAPPRNAIKNWTIYE